MNIVYLKKLNLKKLIFLTNITPPLTNKKKVYKTAPTIIMSITCFRTITPTTCAWSGEIIKRGEIAYKYDDQNTFNKKIRELISPKLAENGLPIGIRCLISQFYSIKSKGVSTEKIFCEQVGNFDIKINKRGRVIRKPVRLADEEFITGSGVSGCDQYDRSYDNGDINSYEREWRDKGTCDLNDFVVSDGEIGKENSESEEECDIADDESCDNWSETDEEDFSDSEWCDDD